jgi:hypothetical protein
MAKAEPQSSQARQSTVQKPPTTAEKSEPIAPKEIHSIVQKMADPTIQKITATPTM